MDIGMDITMAEVIIMITMDTMAITATVRPEAEGPVHPLLQTVAVVLLRLSTGQVPI